MTEIIKKPDYKSLFYRVSTLIEESRRKAVKQVNIIIVQIQTYWEIHLKNSRQCPENSRKGNTIALVVVLGYPNETPIEEEFEDFIKYWQDERNVLHVPKRKLGDILHKNSF